MWVEHLRLLALAWVVAGCGWAFAAGTADIDARTVRIDEAIQAQQLTMLAVQEEGESEGSPPEIRFYSRRGQLVAVQIDTGHETWRARITVYFGENGAPIKYSRVVSARAETPETEAVFYRDGQALPGGPVPRVQPSALLAAFNALQALRRSAAAY